VSWYLGSVWFYQSTALYRILAEFFADVVDRTLDTRPAFIVYLEQAQLPAGREVGGAHAE
jgi:hypothetical protein